MSLASKISDLATQIGTTIKTLTGRVSTLESRPTITGATAIVVVTTLPATPDPNTVYLVKPS